MFVAGVQPVVLPLPLIFFFLKVFLKDPLSGPHEGGGGGGPPPPPPVWKRYSSTIRESCLLETKAPLNATRNQNLVRAVVYFNLISPLQRRVDKLDRATRGRRRYEKKHL